MNQKYSPGMRERVLRMIDQARASGEHRNLMTALRHIEGLSGMSPETLHVWHCCRGVDTGKRPGVPTGVVEENKSTAARERRTAQSQGDPQDRERVFREGARPPLTEMIRFLIEHREWFGVEFLRRVLKDAAPGFLTSRRYRAAKTRPASARHLRNELLIAVIKRLHEKNYGIYRVRKVHALLKRKD